MTEREKELFEFIVKFKQTNGYNPTIRDMCFGINTKSVSHVQEMIERLREEGYIDYIEKISRSIHIKKFPKD